MSDFDRNIATARSRLCAPEVAVDAGLRAYMIRVYNYMADRRGADRRRRLAHAIRPPWRRDPVAGGHHVLTPFGQTIFSGPLMWVLILAPLGLVFFLSFRINRLQRGTALALFLLYAGAARALAGVDLPGLHRRRRSRGCSSSRPRRSAR